MATYTEKNEDRDRAQRLLDKLKKVEKQKRFERVKLDSRTTAYVTNEHRKEMYEQYRESQ